MDNGTSCGNDGTLAYRDVLDDIGADADMGTMPDFNSAGERGMGGEVDEIIQEAVMLDNRATVDDAPDADSRTGIDDR